MLVLLWDWSFGLLLLCSDLFALEKLMQTVTSNQEEMKEIETQDFFSKKNNFIQTLNQANGYITSINDGMREIKEQQELRKEDQRIFDTFIKPKEEKFKLTIEAVQEATNVYKNTEINAVEEANRENNGTEMKRRATFGKDLLLVSVQKNDEALKARRKDLVEIKQVSAQIKDLTEGMKTELQEQGENVKSIESNVLTTVENTAKAKNEIDKANELSIKNRKKMCFFILLVILVAGTIIGLILYLTVLKK